jgi:hypothetical protein
MEARRKKAPRTDTHFVLNAHPFNSAASAWATKTSEEPKGKTICAVRRF